MQVMAMMFEMSVCQLTTASKPDLLICSNNTAETPYLKMYPALYRLASCGGDRSVFSWDVATGRIIRKFRGHDGVANSVS